MVELLTSLFSFLLFIYSPIAVLIGLPLVIASAYEIAFTEHNEKSFIFVDLLVYLPKNWSKNRDYRRSLVIGCVLLITGSAGLFILIKGLLS